MKISIFLNSIDRDKALARFMTERIQQAFLRHRHAIDRIEVRIRDINGLRGGKDKECKILVSRPNTPPLVVTEVHYEPGQAFRSALKRAVPNFRSTLQRALRRRTSKRDLVRAIKLAA